MISRCPSCAAEVSDDAEKCPSCHWDFKAFKRLPPAGAKIEPPAAKEPPAGTPPPPAEPRAEGLRVLNFSDMEETKPSAKTALPEAPKTKAPPLPVQPESSFGQGLKADLPFSIPTLSPRAQTPEEPAAGSIPVLPPVKPGTPPKTPFEAPPPAPSNSLPAAGPPPPPAPQAEKAPAKKSIPETQKRKTAVSETSKKALPVPQLIGAAVIIGLLAMTAVYFTTKPDAGTAKTGSSPAFPKAGQEETPAANLPPLVSRQNAPPQEPEKIAPAPAEEASIAAAPEPKPLVAPQLRPSAASAPIFEAAKSSDQPSRPSAFFAAPPKPAASAPPTRMEKIAAARPPAPEKAGPAADASWIFEGKAYDLISLDALSEATLIFSDKTGKELARTTTTGAGNYKISLQALPEGYRLSVQAQDYSDKYIDEIDPPFSKLDLNHRKELAKIAARNPPWIGAASRTKRNFVAIPKYLPD